MANRDHTGDLMAKMFAKEDRNAILGCFSCRRTISLWLSSGNHIGDSRRSKV